MAKEKYRVIVANITWNDSGWRNIYTNPKAGHEYAKNHPGHESLNFKFDKNVFDTKERVYGFIQHTKAPIRLSDKSIVIFYSKNLKTKKGELVGIYGDVEILKKSQTAHYIGFENDEFQINISAKKDLSLLFPISLDSSIYSENKRLVPQVGYKYKKEWFAEKIIIDEIKALKKSGIRVEEYKKLKKIYTFISGKEYQDDEYSDDIKEQEEILVEIRKGHDREKEIQKIREYVSTNGEEPLEKVWVGSKQYKRNNAIIAELKYLRGEKCQLCGQAIIKKDGSSYTEAAHIRPKSDGGSETPENLIILCPNHHKEFDLGDKEIISLTKDDFQFKLNGKTYTVNLTLV